MKNIKATLKSIKNGVTKYDLVYTNNQNEEVEQKNMYSGDLVDLLIEEIEQENKTNDWFAKDLKNLETKFKNLDSEFDFEKAIDLFNTTPKNELLNYHLELLYLFKTTRENKR